MVRGSVNERLLGMAMFQLNLTDRFKEDLKKAGESIPFSGLLRWMIIAISPKKVMSVK